MRITEDMATQLEGASEATPHALTVTGVLRAHSTEKYWAGQQTLLTQYPGVKLRCVSGRTPPDILAESSPRVKRSTVRV